MCNVHSRLLFKSIIQIALFVCLWAGPGQAAGGVLKIETQTTVRVQGDLLTVDITAQNNGTVAAHDVQTRLTIFDEAFKGPLFAELGPGQNQTVRFEKNLAGLVKGRHPFIVRVDFHDANQYPFSALSVTTFDYQDVVDPGLTIESQDITLQKTGTLRYAVKNTGTAFKQGRAKLILPKEFSAQTLETDFSIAAGSGKIITFEIDNAFALNKAEYPVFCSFEFDLNGVRHTQIARTRVNIVEKENLFRRLRWLWVALTVLLTISLVVVIIKDHLQFS